MEKPDTKSKILLVDDTPSTISMVRTALEAAGHYVFVATSGEKALKSAELAAPDLILLDILMPIMDGYETCRRLKAQETTRDIPVIFISALTGAFDKVKGFDLGGVDYVTKPIETEELLARVNTHLTMSRLQRELLEAKAQLEEKGLMRTEELREANLQLRQEIAERERTQAALIASEEKYRSVMEASGEPIVVYDIEGRVVYCNPAFTRVFGWTLAELLGKRTDYVPEENWPETNAAISELFGGEKGCCTFESRRYTKKGDIIDVIISASVYRDSRGNALGMSANVRDITQRKRAEEALRKSEERYRAIVEDQTELICRYLPDGTLIFVNEAFCRYFGEKRQDLIAKSFFHMMDGNAHESLPDYAAAFDQANPVATHERGTRGPEGESRWLEWTDRAIFDEKGQLVEFQSVGRDITLRKEAEESLKRSEERYALAQRAGNIGSWDWDIQAGVLRWSDTIEPMFGFEHGKFAGTFEASLECVHSEDRQYVIDSVNRCLHEHADYDIEHRIVHPNGTIRWVSEQGNVTRDRHGNAVRMVGIVRDITERRLAEEQRLSHLEFLKHLEHIDQVIRHAVTHEQMMKDVLESVLHILRCDRAWILFPCDPDAPSFRVPMEVTNPGFPGAFSMNEDVPVGPGIAEVFRLALETDGPLTCGPGSTRPVPPEIVRHFFVQSQMQIVLPPRVGRPWMFGVHQCSYARTWTAEEQRLFQEIASRLTDGLSSLLFLRDLRESEERYRTLFEESTDAILIVRPEGEIIDANPSCAELLGTARDELVGADIRQFWWDPAERSAFREKCAEKGFIREYEWKARRRDGTQRICLMASSAWRDEDGKLLGYLTIARDMTQSRLLEQRLRQAQKMEAIGTLAGGIAHDFNNLLFVITGNMELALDLGPQAPELHGHLQEALKAAVRARDLVSQILAFSRQRTTERSLISINPLVKEVLKFLRSSIPSTIRIELRLTEDPLTIVADPTEIHQVVMNLCTNAAHAMRKHGGILEVELARVEIDHDFSLLHDSITPGSYAKLTVSDTGHGVSRDNLERIFDPYFTTKQRGEGTGLGLAVVHGIVKSYGGTISVYSETGKGSTFHVFLPVSRQAKAMPADTATPVLPTGRERILVVDDEPAVTHTVDGILKSLGYHVTAVNDSSEALDLFKAMPHQFDLVITDMTMPKMTGTDLAKELMSITPDIPLILCTGFSELVSKERAEKLGFRSFLMKPIRKTDLAQTVHSLLHGGKTPNV